MKKRLILVISLILVVLMAVAGTVVALEGDEMQVSDEVLEQQDQETRAYQLGLLSVQYAQADASAVLATIEDVQITQSMLDRQRALVNLNAGITANQNLTDQELLREMLRDALWTLEAKKQGYTASQEDINAFDESIRQGYDLPGGKEVIDSYCEGAGITLDGYYLKLHQEAPDVIVRNKLQEQVMREYCLQNGLDEENAASSTEAFEAFRDYLDQLYETYESEIVYAGDETVTE